MNTNLRLGSVGLPAWLLILSNLASTALCVQLPGSVAAQVADLKDQLEKGLKVRRPEEFQFIATVVTMVENDELPLDLVQSTFQWVRKNKYAARFPFVYFQRALRERAAELGITVP